MFTIYSDGGSRGNPGKAACAFVIYKDNEIVKKSSKYLGIATNNVSEYSGVIFALTAFVKDFRTADKITFAMDSELVVKQLTGVYRIKDSNLIDLSLKVKKLIKDNNLSVNFVHVRREKNRIADKMLNEKLDETSRL